MYVVAWRAAIECAVPNNGRHDCGMSPSLGAQATTDHNSIRRVAFLLGIALFASYAYFWQSRCWNSATRLMLTYALADRGTICIDGLEGHTRDRAFVNGHYYCDKAPGQSFLGLPYYLPTKLMGISHPLQRKESELRYWWPDYLVTIGTSGLCTASLGAVLFYFALSVGCSPWAAAVVSATYGLATPAWTYATLYYGHQSAAFFAFLAFAILYFRRRTCGFSMATGFMAGASAGLSVVIEYPLALIAVGLAGYVASSRSSLRALAAYVFAGLLWAILLACYHMAAFGGPLQFGYHHETESQFQGIYSTSNTFGLSLPSPYTAAAILASPRGLVWHAPASAVAVLGFTVLMRRREYGLLFVSAWSFGSMLLLNASHPTWTGGFATGPRYLLPALPFLMIPLAVLCGSDRRWVWPVGIAGIIGMAIIAGCTAYGGRVPDLGQPGGDNPLLELVLPAIRNGHLDKNAGKLMLAPLWSDLPAGLRWASLMPLLVFLVGMAILVRRLCNHAERQCPPR